MTETDLNPAITPQQFAILVCLGALLWLGAALLLRFLAPFGIYEGVGRIFLYVLIIPGTWPFVLLLIRVAGLRRSQALTGVATALAAATLLDGAALAWVPWLYGTSIEYVAGAGAAILWGAGVFLVLGAFVGRSAS